MPSTEDLVRNAGSYARGFWPETPRHPTVAVVACMDARIDVFSVLGLRPGDAHVIRNAGGLVTDDVIRSLAISQRLLGTREIMLIHHTDCGMTKFRDEEFRAGITAETGAPPPWHSGAFVDVEADLRQCLRTVAGCPFLPHRDRVRGFVYHVEDGTLTEVPAA